MKKVCQSLQKHVGMAETESDQESGERGSLVEDAGGETAGHFNYYGISGNYPDINRFNFKILKMTRYWMNRRSQKQTQTVEKFRNYLERHPLPKPEIKHVIYVY